MVVVCACVGILCQKTQLSAWLSRNGRRVPRICQMGSEQVEKFPAHSEWCPEHIRRQPVSPRTEAALQTQMHLSTREHMQMDDS